MTSTNELAVIQAKEGDLWEPTTEAELDQMEAEGIQQPVIQPHVVALDPPLAEGGSVRCLTVHPALSHALRSYMLLDTAHWQLYSLVLSANKKPVRAPVPLV